MSAAKMKVAMVGVGGFGGHRRMTLRKTGLYEIVAAYDLDADALARCEKEDGAKPVESYEALLETPGIEAMVISTGGKFHAEQTLAALDKGLHVFVEKPLCATAEETHALLAKQRETGLVVGLGHTDHSRDATSLATRDLIERGALGTIATFEKTTAHSGGLMIKPGDWRGDPEKNPGGMLFQCGVHGLHELMFYFGPIKAVTAKMRYDVNDNTGTADVAQCILEFASGLVGVLNAYHVVGYRHTLSIFGTQANLYRNDRYFDEGTSLELQEERLDGAKEPLVPVDLTPYSELDSICGNVESFYTAVRDGGTPYPSLGDGARAVLAVFAAEASARAGKTVSVEDL